MVLIDGMAGVCLWSGDLTGSGGLIGVVLMKVPDEVVIQYVSGRDPGSLLGAVSLPYHQVLETADRVGEASIDETRRWRRWGGGNQGTLSDRLDSEDVECGMDAHGSGEFESHRCRDDDLDNIEGTNEARGQLLSLHPQGKVTGGEPYLLT